jgi:hypothetical protein
MADTVWELEPLATENAPTAAYRYRIHADGAPMSWRNVLDGLADSDPFRRQFCEFIRACPFDACFWETPAVSAPTVDRDFEYVVVDAPVLARLSPSAAPFSAHFRAADVDEEIVSFANLGGDAWLIVPLPVGPDAAYPHLIAFARHAPPQQQRALWRTAANEVRRKLTSHPLWLSTSGLGVAWLHLRIDRSPKYYTYPPYRSTP